MAAVCQEKKEVSLSVSEQKLLWAPSYFCISTLEYYHWLWMKARLLEYSYKKLIAGCWCQGCLLLNTSHPKHQQGTAGTGHRAPQSCPQVSPSSPTSSLHPKNGNSQSLKPSPSLEFATPAGRAAPRTAGSSLDLGSPGSRGWAEPSPWLGPSPGMCQAVIAFIHIPGALPRKLQVQVLVD